VLGREEADLLGAGTGHLDSVGRGEDRRCSPSDEHALELLGHRGSDSQLVLYPGSQLVEGGVGDEVTALHDDHAVYGLGDLSQDVAGDEHGAPFFCQAAQKVSQPADALGVEAVGWLVEDQDLGFAQQCRSEAEALAHPEGELAHPSVRRAREIDQVEDLVDGVIGLVVLEGAVVDTVLALAIPGSVWVWVAGGVHLYALGWLTGLWASFATRPQPLGLLGDDALYVRDGVFTEVVVPYTAIHGPRLVRGSNLGRSGIKIDPELRAATLALGDTTVVVDVDPAAQLLVNGNRLPGPVVTLAITVDRSHDFVQALSRLRSANKDGSPMTPGAATLPAG
jgi:hypothetical protein